MKIWTLMENSACREDLTAEHGLSLYLETNGQKVLFDSGASAAFAENAEKMGVDLRQVDLAILSHGHYDHSGGLMRFQEINDHAKIYVNQNVFDQCYHEEDRYVGVDPILKESDRLIYVGETLQLGTGMTLCACNEREKRYPLDRSGLTVLENGCFVPEEFRHEQYLLVEEGEKRILISGCSHKGILNIVHWFQPDVLIGGFHFMNLDPAGADLAQLEASARELQQYHTVYYTGHCTGEEQYKVLKAIMGDQLHQISTGAVLEV